MKPSMKKFNFSLEVLLAEMERINKGLEKVSRPRRKSLANLARKAAKLAVKVSEDV